MKQLRDSKVDVLITGAGPTGLMMACQLAIHGISFRIIDKKRSPSNNSGALILQARSLEILESIGLAGEALKEGIIADKVNILFNGKIIVSTSIKEIGGSLSQFPFLLMLEQSKTEKLLTRFLEAHGHTIERETQFLSLIQDSGNTISIVAGIDGAEHSITSKYLVAADGGNSTIRGLLNIPFSGITYPKPIFIMDCKAKTDFIPGEINFVFSDSTVTGFFPLKNSRWRIDGSLPEEMERMQTVKSEEVEKNLPRWTNVNFSPESNEWFSVSHSHQKYSGSIQLGNCFLAGDAAHVNTPVGAQGMNTGLQDAFNLAWKLALVLNHNANPELLKTYSDERSGITKGFARYADIVFKLVTSTNRIVKILRKYVLKFFFVVLFPFIEKQKLFRHYFFRSISQLDIHYPESILSLAEIEGSFLLRAPGKGESLPYVVFSLKGEITNTHKILNQLFFNLIVLDHALPDSIRKLADQFKLNVILIPKLPETKDVYHKLGISMSGFLLIRPDMHIALHSVSMESQSLHNYLNLYLIAIPKVDGLTESNSELS
ncbi:MAG: FAD-dependent monooxygenase [Bacteroidetes bacterium]|nr:FAD-dependent monooxygenase [Bacteroidota bacterium]